MIPRGCKLEIGQNRSSRSTLEISYGYCIYEEGIGVSMRLERMNMDGKRGDLESLTPYEKKWYWKHSGEGIGVYEIYCINSAPVS
jgi:hypothetical protein